MGSIKLYTPAAVPFTETGKIDFSAFEFNLQRWSQTSLDGIVLPGSNSESPFLSSTEKIELWKISIELFKETGQELIAGTGVETTDETISLTAKSAEIGAAKALILPPHFYKAKLTNKILVEHFYAAAEASPIPIWVYNMPLYTGFDMGIELLRKLADHPNIAGIKDSGNNVIKMTMLLHSHPEFQVFSGSGGSLLPFLSIGASGCISALANIFPDSLRQISDAFKAGDLEHARRIQLAVSDINAAVTAQFGIAGLKFSMDQLGYKGGYCRRPLQEANQADQQKILDILQALNTLLPFRAEIV